MMDRRRRPSGEDPAVAATLSHTDWLGLLLDRELTHRRDKRLAARLRYARLRQHPVIEDVDKKITACHSRSFAAIGYISTPRAFIAYD